MLRKIIEKKDFSDLSKGDIPSILTFINFQYSRTPKMKKAIDDSIEKLGNELVESILKKKDSQIKLIWEGAHLTSIAESLNGGALLLSDLYGFVTINKTKIPFITSDHPVIFYNPRFCNFEGGHEGTQSPGLCIFYPLSRDVLLIFYDSEYYKFPQNKEGNFITNEEDILKINKLQYHNCEDFIYFFEDSFEKSILDEIKEFKKSFKKTERSRLDKFYSAQKPNSELLRMGFENIREKLDFSFFETNEDKPHPGKLYRSLELLELKKRIDKSLEKGERSIKES